MVEFNWLTVCTFGNVNASKHVVELISMHICFRIAAVWRKHIQPSFSSNVLDIWKVKYVCSNEVI